MTKFFYFILLYSFFYSFNCFASNDGRIQYTVDDGLSSNTIYGITEDVEGNIWFATNNGVSIYNGYSFETLDSKDGLLDNVILKVYKDRKNRIWIFGYNGSILMFQNQKLHSYQNSWVPKGIDINKFIYEDDKNRLWIGGLNSNYCIDDTAVYKINLPDDYINGVILINGTKILTETAWYDINFVEDNFVANKLKTKAYFENSILLQKDDSTIVMYNENQLYSLTADKLLNITSNAILSELSGVQNIRNIDKEYWFCSRNNGIYQFDLKRKNLNQIINNKRVNDIFKDQNGNFWIGTTNSGIYKIPEELLQLTSIPNEKDHYGNATRFCSLNEKILIATSKGSILEVDKNKLSEFYRLPNTTYISLIKYYNGTLFINAGDNFYFISNNELKHPEKKTSVKEILEVNKQIILRTSDNLSSLVKDENDNWIEGEILYEGLVRSACVDDSAMIYVLDDKSVFKINTKDKTKQLESYNINDISDLLYLKDKHTLLISSYSEGLLFKSDSNEILINHQNNSINNEVHRIKELNSKYIAAFTKGGLFVIDNNKPDNPKYWLFDKNIGLASNQVKDVFIYNNFLYISCNGNLYSFENFENIPYSNSSCESLIDLQINAIKKDKVVIEPKEIIKIQEGKGQLNFRVVDKNYKSVAYYYQIPELDKGWIKIQDQTINIIGLNRGKYNVKIKSLSILNCWSPILNQKFEVVPKFVDRTSIRILFFLFLLLIGLLIIRQRMTHQNLQIKHQNDALKYKQTLSQLKLEALSIQMNPHFINNSLNSILHLVNSNNLKSANKYIVSFSRLLSKSLVELSKSLIPLEEEINYLKHYIELERIRFEQPFTFNLIVQESLDLSEYLVPNMILQPLVENAIWHGISHDISKGVINLKISERQDMLTIELDDNGVGINKSNEKAKNFGTSISLNNIKERVKVINDAFDDIEIDFKIADKTDFDLNEQGVYVKIVIKQND